jgi:hypothetical protein
MCDDSAMASDSDGDLPMAGNEPVSRCAAARHDQPGGMQEGASLDAGACMPEDGREMALKNKQLLDRVSELHGQIEELNKELADEKCRTNQLEESIAGLKNDKSALELQREGETATLQDQLRHETARLQEQLHAKKTSSRQRLQNEMQKYETLSRSHHDALTELSKHKISNTQLAAQLVEAQDQVRQARAKSDYLANQMVAELDNARRVHDGVYGTAQPREPPKVDDGAIETQWIQLRGAIGNCVRNHMVWDVDAAEAMCDAMGSGSGSGSAAVGELAWKLHALRDGIRVFGREQAICVHKDPDLAAPQTVRTLKGLGTIILQSIIWRALGRFVFGGYGEVWGGPKGHIFITLCNSLNRKFSFSFQGAPGR